jgi:large-conductance mechanosensitive channel
MSKKFFVSFILFFILAITLFFTVEVMLEAKKTETAQRTTSQTVKKYR